jgi:hypothetical protein
MDEQIAGNLRRLGVNERDLEESLEIFSKPTVEEARIQMGRFHYGAGYSQVIMPMFRILYAQKDTRKSVLGELKSTNVPKKVIDEYFIDMGTQPFSVLYATHQEIPREIKLKFIDTANKIMFEYVKRAIGIDK